MCGLAGAWNELMIGLIGDRSDSRNPVAFGEPESARPESNAYSVQIKSLESEIAALRRENMAQRKRLSTMTDALKTAGSLQRDLCTCDVPEVDGLDVCVFYRLAEAVGGDAYEIVRLDETRVAFAVIDATGHGVAASLLATYAQQAFRRALRDASSWSGIGPADVLADINRDLVSVALEDCQSVAALVGIFDERSRVLRVARGGAPNPLVSSVWGTTSTLDCSGPLLGVVEGAVFSEVARTLRPGDTVLLYSDGLNEVLAPPHARIANDIAQTPWLRSVAVGALEEACRDLDALQGLRDDYDDTTVILLRVQPEAVARVVSA